DEAEVYDPNTGAWYPIASLPFPRAYFSAAILPDGRVLISGGLAPAGWSAADLNSSLIYDPVLNSYTSGPNMNFLRYGHTLMALPDGRVLVRGGVRYAGGGLFCYPPPEIYDPDTNTFERL
ncbi:MAG: hypothetical protein RMK80_10080, partial [Pseudobdellovibrionaceae bacterium]|nr:hypothetical protein [Pseudobdellovibrionaceae bacterium]